MSIEQMTGTQILKELKQYPEYAGKTDYYIKKELGVSGKLATVSVMKKILASLNSDTINKKSEKVKKQPTATIYHKTNIPERNKQFMTLCDTKEETPKKVTTNIEVAKNIMVVLIWSREQYDINKEEAIPGSQSSALAKIGFKYVSTNKNGQGITTKKSKETFQNSQKCLYDMVHNYLCGVNDPIAKNDKLINDILMLTNEYGGVYSRDVHKSLRVMEVYNVKSM